MRRGGRRYDVKAREEKGVRCKACMKRFGKRSKIVKYQNEYYHKWCLEELKEQRHRNYGGIRPHEKKPPIRAV